MDGFFDTLTARIVAGTVVAVLVLVLYFSFDVYQFLARRDFTHLNAYLIHFTRHEHQSTEDKVQMELIGYKIPLKDICKNRFMFWVIFYYSLKTTVENPVLYFGTWRHLLVPVRGRVSEIWRAMVLKRAAGYPFREMPSQLALVYDPSADSANFVMRIVLVQNRDIEMFAEYLAKPPMNTDNFDFVSRMVRAYNEKTGSFINVRVTAA